MSLETELFHGVFLLNILITLEEKNIITKDEMDEIISLSHQKKPVTDIFKKKEVD